MSMNDTTLRRQLVNLLRGGEAHGEVADAITSFPPTMAGSRLSGVPHTPWRLLEHMRIAQGDILEFCQNPEHVSPEFPGGYWPEDDLPPSAAIWDRAVAVFCGDLQAMQDLVTNPATELLTPILHGQGQTILREALLVADHNSFHLGQLSVIRHGLS